jgi:hypothetical protein
LPEKDRSCVWKAIFFEDWLNFQPEHLPARVSFPKRLTITPTWCLATGANPGLIAPLIYGRLIKIINTLSSTIVTSSAGKLAGNNKLAADRRPKKLNMQVVLGGPQQIDQLIPYSSPNLSFR